MNSTLIKVIQQLEIKTDERSVKTFGYGLGVILLILSGLQLFFRETLYPWLPAMAIASWLITWVYYKAILAVYYPWMIITKPLGIGITYLILTLTFYLILLPLGLTMRILGKDPLKSKRGDKSYWEDRESPDDKRINRMF